MTDTGQEPAGSGQAAGGYADIGERVAGLLRAAEGAAEQIRDEARIESDRLLAAARIDAETVRQEAAAFGENTRAAVEAYASQRRREADEEAQNKLAESENHARAVRDAADAVARQIEDAARDRAQRLIDESKAADERLRKALVVLRRMTADLEAVVEAPEAAAPAESLADALWPGQRETTPTEQTA